MLLYKSTKASLRQEHELMVFKMNWSKKEW